MSKRDANVAEFPCRNRTIPNFYVFNSTFVHPMMIISSVISTFLALAPLPDTATWIGEGDQAFGEYGKSVCTAGDVNGDGYDDILVGMHYYSGPEYREGKVFLYFGGASGPSTTADWSWESNSANATLGISVSTAGDVNADGYDDILLGAHTYSGVVPNEGAAFVFFGSASGPGDSPDWAAYGGQSGGDFGGTVSDAGDINNDGYDDITIGAVFYSNGEMGEGRSYVYYGSADGLDDTPWTAEINQAGAQFGGHVSGAGDIDNDGFDDLLIGARKYSGGSSSEGAIYVYYGSASGLGPSHDWMFESNSVQAKLGQSVSGAGDVNGDGFADIIAGAHNYSSPETDEGRIYAFYGSASGLPASPSFTFETNLGNALLGNQVSDAGDVNDDGYDDVIAGSREYSNGEASEGRAYIFYGSASGLNAADFWTEESNQESAFFGYSVHSAGDVNQDGADDVIVGAKYWDGGETDEGAAFFYPGIPVVYPCTAPENLTLLDVGTTTATISWDGPLSASGYKIIAKKSGSPALLFTTTATTFTLSGLSGASNYRISILAKCSGTFSPRSAPLFLVTD